MTGLPVATKPSAGVSAAQLAHGLTALGAATSAESATGQHHA
jgi:hypothetical protein